MFRKIALLGSTAALVAGSLMIGGVAHAGAPPVNATHDTISCNTIEKGTIGFKPSLFAAATSTTDAISVKGALTGCTTNDASITSISGTIKGTLTNDTNGFTSLLGPSHATGTITITWKSVPALTVKTTTVTVASGNVIGNVNSPFGDSASYGQFSISGATTTGSFLGNDNGASSFTNALTVEDAGDLLAMGSTTGIKAINLGSSEISFG